MEKHGRSPRLQLAEEGTGPLLERDYWCVIRDCRFSPRQIAATVRRHFAAFAPAELVVFRANGGDGLKLGDEVDLRIAGAGGARVRVTHVSGQSFTLATLEGHPEAGRITFGSYRNRKGEVLFHIRSRARSKSRLRRAGFLAAGEVMQTSTWSEFVNRVAVAFGNGVRGLIHAETRPCDEEPPEVARHAPTYLAVESP
jgi:hypothetical protein